MFDFRCLQKILPRVYSFIPYYLRPESAFPPAQAFFEVTYRCNLRCEMCHYLAIIEDTETKKTYKREMSTEEVKRAVASLPKSTLITFTGGEAFMKSDFPEILEFAASGHKVHVITNGTLLTDSVVGKLVELRMKSLFGPGMFYVGVSLEGNEELHDKITTVSGSFRKTTRGLERLIALREKSGSRYPLTHLTCVIRKDNVTDLPSVYDYANRLGVNVCNFVLDNTATYWHGKEFDQDRFLKFPPSPVEEISPELLREQLVKLESRSKSFRTKLRFSPNFITLEEIVRYYSNKSTHKDYRCFVPWTKIAFSAYGDVFSCPHYRLGTWDASGEDDPWRGDRARQFRNLLKKETIFPGCLGCCQSEYLGPSGKMPQLIEAKTGGEIFKKVRRKDLAAQPHFHG